MRMRERAEQFEGEVESALVHESGMLFSWIEFDTMKPFERGFFADKKTLTERQRNVSYGYDDYTDLLAYENTGMVTGAYMCAQVWKYRATKDDSALDKVYRCFSGIKALFDMSQKVEPGYYCKPYGWKVTDQLSTDQYLYSMAGLDAFMPFAGPDERRTCVEMIGEMVRWWMRKKYSYPYFGKPLNWRCPRFPVFLWLAFHHTGDADFRAEFDRLCGLPEVRDDMPFGDEWNAIVRQARSRAPYWDIEKRTDLRMVHPDPQCTQSGFLSVEAMLEYNAPHRALWLDKARKLYEAGRKAIGADGMALGAQWLNLKTEELTAISDRVYAGEGTDNPDTFAPTRSGMESAQFARAAVAIDLHLPDLHAVETAAGILSKMDHDKLRMYTDITGAFPPEREWMGRIYSGDAVAHWLWAYWEGCAKYGDRWVARR